MNQINTIKGLIPQHLLMLVPSTFRDMWANRIVKVFKEQNPKLYDEIEQWSVVPEERCDVVVTEILTVADKVYSELNRKV
ncbi:MAG: hypothetical protein IK143_08635 [Bacteroidales bacterium]|nr:hypothetical protein [Bacteroidales bacterium]